MLETCAQSNGFIPNINLELNFNKSCQNLLVKFVICLVGSALHIHCCFVVWILSLLQSCYQENNADLIWIYFLMTENRIDLMWFYFIAIENGVHVIIHFLFTVWEMVVNYEKMSLIDMIPVFPVAINVS